MKFDVPVVLKNYEENSSAIKIWIICTLPEDQYKFLITSGTVLRMRSISDKNFRVNQNTCITFLKKLFPFWDNVKKYSRDRQATDDNMANAHLMLDT
jgi:hypothetical protein